MTEHDLRCLSEGTASVDTQQRAAVEIEDLRISVIAFGAPYAARLAESYGLPDGHLLPVHYDALQRAGARMTDFVRAETVTV